MTAAPEAGQLDNGAHILPLRVYWEDTDAGGIVYHASFLRFMERGRTEMLRAIGLEQSALRREHGLRYVVSGMTISFRSPAMFDDSLIVITRCTKLGAASMILRQSVLRDGETLADATVTCASIDEAGKPVRPPATLRAALERCSAATGAGGDSRKP